MHSLFSLALILWVFVGKNPQLVLTIILVYLAMQAWVGLNSLWDEVRTYPEFTRRASLFVRASNMA